MTFDLNEQEIGFIVAKLGKFPMEEVEPIVNKIRHQANNQPQPKSRNKKVVQMKSEAK